jgi:hypothetical protein
MYTITISKKLLNGMSLPGMGRSAEINGISPEQNLAIRQAISQGGLQVEFEEEPGVFHPVTNLWPDPHSMDRLTVFIK